MLEHPVAPTAGRGPTLLRQQHGPSMHVLHALQELTCPSLVLMDAASSAYPVMWGRSRQGQERQHAARALKALIHLPKVCLSRSWLQ